MRVYYVLTGPTASGKTGRLVSFAQYLQSQPVFAISADSRQVYRHMNIGTGKPTPDELEMLPHYGLNILEPGINYSVYQYLIQAAHGLRSAYQQKAMAWVCGGTGLYIRAMTESLDLGVPPRPLLRDALAKKMDEISPRRVAQELDLTPVDPDNPVRVIRQAEFSCREATHLQRVYEYAGVDPQQEDLQADQPGVEYEKAIAEISKWRCGGIFVLDPGKDILLERMSIRIQGMFDSGLVDELAELRRLGYGETDVVEGGIGYREAGEVLDGTISIAAAVESTIIRTRQYAKRQRTYFKGRGWPVVDDENLTRVFHSIQE